MPSPLIDLYRKALADAGVPDDRDEYLIVEELGQLAQQGAPELFRFDPIFEASYREIREANSPGTIGGIKNTAVSAYDRSRQALNVLGGIGGSDAEDIAERERSVNARPSSVAWEDWTRSTGQDAVKAFLRDPIEITANIVASGLAGSLPAIGGGLAGGVAGAKIGGLLGAPASPLGAGLGAAAGGTVGAAIGTGTGSLAVEYGSKFLEVLREAGADLTDAESITEILSDPEIASRARELGLRRGLPVAAFDAASAGLAGKFLKGARFAAGSPVRAGVAETLTQGALGGAGEVAGALGAGEPVRPGSVFEEIVGEAGPGAIEVGGAAARRAMLPVEEPASIAQPPIQVTAPVAQVAAPVLPVAPVARTNAQIIAAAEAMTDEQKVARLAELSAKPTRTPAEDTEYEILAASAPTAAAPAATTIAPVAPAAQVETARDQLYREAEEARTQVRQDYPAEYERIVNASGLSQPELDTLLIPAPAEIQHPSEVQNLVRDLTNGFPGNRFNKLYDQLAPENATGRFTRGGTADAPQIGFDPDVPGGRPDVAAANRARDAINAIIGLYGADPLPDLFTPQTPTAEMVRALEPAAFVSYYQAAPEGHSLTEDAMALGDTTVTPEDITQLQTLRDEAGVAFKAAMAAQDIDTASALAAKQQFFSEAYQQATKTGNSAPKPSEIPPVVPSSAPAPILPATPELSAEILQSPVGPKLDYGPLVIGEPSVDLSVIERDLTPQQWETVVRTNLETAPVPLGDKQGNRALTRVGVAFQKPGSDEVIFTGLTRPQEIKSVAGAKEYGGVAVQRMGAGTKSRRVQDGGDQPVLFREVVAAGYKPIAVVHFQGEPSAIFQRFSSPQQFNAAWDASGRTPAPQTVAAAVTPNAYAAVAISDATVPVTEIRGLRRIQAEIDRVAGEWIAAEKSGDSARVEQMKRRYEQLHMAEDRAVATNQTQTGDVPLEDFDIAQRLRDRRAAAALPIEAARAQEFAAVVNRLRSQGARVDLFTQEFFQQSTTAYLQQQIQALNLMLAGASTESQRKAVGRRLRILTSRLADVNAAAGAAFTPYHIALGLSDVQNASLDNLVTLLHEASEALAMGLNPSMRGTVQRAVLLTATDLRKKASESARRTGIPKSRETDPADLLSETLAQNLAAEGVPESTSLAQAIVRWIKDLYYRVAMAAQRAFGAEPNPETVIAWFENQLRRIISGDYDYRLARLLDPYMKVAAQENVRRFARPQGTPGGVTDYFDPYTRSVRQPSVITDSSEAFDWNVQFRQTEPGGQDIPEQEARARIHAAAVNKVLETMEEIRTDSGTDLPWDQWWKLVGSGDDPRMILATAQQKFPGSETAKIGGDRMTDPMNQLAGLEARQIIERIQSKAYGRLAETNEQIESESDKQIAAAREINRIEADRRNAELTEGIIKEKLRAMIKRFVADYSKGLSAAEQHGELAEAIRQAEGLLESDAVPEQYQEVFKSVLDGEVTVWSYIREIARLELPLSDMTPAEVRRAIRDNLEKNPELAALQRNKPLLVALSTLAVKNQAIMDDIALGRINDATKYAAIHSELEEIRKATDEQLRTLVVAMDERGKATTLRERIRDDYIKRRRALRTAQERVRRARTRATAIEGALPGLKDAVEQAQIEGAGSMSEWTPKEGAKWTAMSLDNGNWSAQERVLRFNPDGTAVDGAAIRSALFANNEWLKENENKRGGALYESVLRQTTELMMLDVQRASPAAQAWKITKMLAPIVENAKRIGGPASQRVVKMLNEFEFVRFSHGQEVQDHAKAWTLAFNRVQKSTGISDIGVFRETIYDPINYFLNTNPGMDEEAAIRHATNRARERLPKAPDDSFSSAFGELLRQTKANSEFLLARAEQYGSFVADPRIKGSLRRAVAQGWLTNMRQIDGGLVRRIVDDMQKAGWKLGFKQEGAVGREREMVAGATTFRDLSVEDTSQQNTQQLNALLGQLFPAGVIRDWLEPFINKGGTEVFSFNGEPISQLDLQDVWQQSGNNVLTFIDGLTAKVDIGAPEENNPDPLARFRLSILQQLDGLFGMEAKHAYEWSQTRDLFDPLGAKPHVMMDARLNDQIPPEHLDFAMYDPHTAQMLLSEIAFHGKFGRNGEAMMQALREMSDTVSLKKAQYESLRGTTRRERELEAKLRGWTLRDLENAAQSAADVEALKNSIESLMAVGRPGGPFDQSRAGLEFMRFMTGQVVDNPKTGLYNWLSNFERPFAQRSLGPAAIRNSVVATGQSLKGALGSLFEALNLNLLHSSEAYQETTNVLGGSRNQPWSQVVADMAPGGRQTAVDKWFIKPLRLIKYVQHKGARPIPLAEAKEFPRLAPIPGLGVGNYLGQLAGAGGVITEIQQLERMIGAGIRFFAANRDAANDPNFRFKAADLGFGRLDQGVFDWWRTNSIEYGLGNLEDIVRGAMARQIKGERLVTKDQGLRIASMSMTEFDGQSSINTTPTVMQEHPMLKTMMPLLRWPFWKMHQVNKSMRTADGRHDYRALVRGLATLALWNLPIGLAFTFALDQYDEDLLKKKSNLPSVGKTAAIPLVGPALELFLSDRSIPDTLKAYLVRTARAGNTYGLAADLAGQIASPSDSGSGRRVFSMDQRILAMSQFLNFQQALTNMAHQDWTTTWASVWNPLIRSLGGNGAIHGLDLVNAAFGLDNAEARQVMRTNSQNWIRAAAGETDIPVRRGGGSGTPTPMSVWTRQMSMAAMANDRIGFMEAYRNALDASRKAVASDPTIPLNRREQEAATRVLSSWRSRDPLAVLEYPPTPVQLAKLYSAMNDDGRQDVQQAIARYEQFTRMIRPTQVEVRQRQQINRMTNPRLLAPAGIGPLF